MKIIDPKITDSLGKYIFQSVLATISIFLVLIFLDILEHTALIATLGASVFIIFVMPHAYISHPKQVLGGYIVGMICGCLSYFLMVGADYIFSAISFETLMIGFGALAVGASMFLMTILNLEHPPAVGVALGLVINQWNHRTIVFIIFGIIILLVVKRLLKPVLIDLI